MRYHQSTFTYMRQVQVCHLNRNDQANFSGECGRRSQFIELSKHIIHDPYSQLFIESTKRVSKILRILSYLDAVQVLMAHSVFNLLEFRVNRL